LEIEDIARRINSPVRSHIPRT
jgi:hypothetical protein